MVETYVLIQADVGKPPSVMLGDAPPGRSHRVSEVDQIKAVVTAEVVAGHFDATVRITAEYFDSLARPALSKIQAVD